MSVREFLNTRGGYVAVGAILVLAIGISYFTIKSVFGGPDLQGQSHFIDSQTGKVFTVTLKEGMKTAPLESNPNAFPAETCYWTKDGKIKDEPTWILMNHYVKKSGPTVCPDCGRVVQAQRGKPNPGDEPPPLASRIKNLSQN